MSGVLTVCMEVGGWEKKWRPPLHFCGPHHIPTCQASGENGVSFIWSRWKPNHKSKNTSARSKKTKKNPSRVSCLHTEWARRGVAMKGGGVGRGVGRGVGCLTEEKPVSVNDVPHSFTACPQQSEWQRKSAAMRKHVCRKWQLRCERWQQLRKYEYVT